MHVLHQFLTEAIWQRKVYEVNDLAHFVKYSYSHYIAVVSVSPSTVHGSMSWISYPAWFWSTSIYFLVRASYIEIYLIIITSYGDRTKIGSGQNNTDKMVWTKWYADKMVWTKWYEMVGPTNFLYRFYFN